MSTPRKWTYYRLDRILTDDPPIFFRSWRGFVDRLDRQAMTWVSLDSDPVSRYLKNGEVGFDETTRAAIETTMERCSSRTRHRATTMVEHIADKSTYPRERFVSGHAAPIDRRPNTPKAP
jgi:hypothetical protein